MSEPSPIQQKLRVLCREGQLKEALYILLSTYNPPEDDFTYIQLLQTCILKIALPQGKKIHSFIAHRQYTFATRRTFQNKLINMYVKCRSLLDARKVFDLTKDRDCATWNTIITAYRRNGFPLEAVTLFHQMQRTGLQPDQFTFANVLPACAKMGALEEGIDIHQSIKERGISSNVLVSTALVDMYAKCGSIDKAREVFDEMPLRNVISWNAMIVGYAQNGFVEQALETFKQMQLAGVKPDYATFASVLPACAKMGAVDFGMDIHQSITEEKCLQDVVVATALLDMYAKCGNMHKARELFDKMLKRDVVSWNAMIAGYAQNGFAQKALEIFKQMQLAGVKPDSVSFVSILSACAQMEALKLGTVIHQSIIESGFFLVTIIGNALVDMYTKCGNIDQARELFDRMPQRDIVSWNTMIAGYTLNGFVDRALRTFMQMQLIGMKPNSTTFVSILPACAKMGALEQGMSIHRAIMEGGFLSDVVATALLDMYTKCGSMAKACELFDKMVQKDTVSWNAMIAGYAQNGFVENAYETFKQMQLASVKPNSTTFACILSACTQMGALELGKGIHQIIIESRFFSTITVGNALVDMYAKCGSMHKACELFDNMPQKNVVSWTAMIVGYAQNGFVEKALETFKQMELTGVKPTSTTFASILTACAKMGALEQGMDIHQSIMEGRLLSDVVVASALVDMYAKCGSIDKARELFDQMPQRNVISWNTMIAGYAQNGYSKDALKIFELMKYSGTCPDVVTFASVLFACSHAGLVDEVVHTSIR